MTRILVCAATRSELRACEKGILAAQTSAQFELLLTGVGPAHASKALRDRLVRDVPDIVVSSGFAGALSDAVPPLSWIGAAHVGVFREGRYSAIEGLRLAPLPPLLRRCAVVSADGLVGAAEGAALAASVSFDAPIAVDMESAMIAAACAEAGVHFLVARVVSDTPAHRLPAFLGQFTEMMAAEDSLRRIDRALRGVGAVLASPREAYALVRAGAKWVEALEAGWRSLAPSFS